MYMDFDTVLSNDGVGGCMANKPSCTCSDVPSSNLGCGRSEQACNDCRARRHGTWGLTDHPLASVYSPLQAFEELHDKDVALSRGTIFVKLDLPFMGESVSKGGKCCG